MKTKKIFSNVKDIGDLFLDYVFFEFEMEPLLFTCVDKENNLYFCHCYKLLDEQKWFVVPISVDELISLLEAKIDIRTLILSSEYVLNITIDIKGNETNECKKSSKISKDDLPSVGIMLRCDEEQARSYLNKRIKSSEFILYDHYEDLSCKNILNSSDYWELESHETYLDYDYKDLSYKYVLNNSDYWDSKSHKKYKKNSKNIIDNIDFNTVYAA